MSDATVGVALLKLEGFSGLRGVLEGLFCESASYFYLKKTENDVDSR